VAQSQRSTSTVDYQRQGAADVEHWPHPPALPLKAFLRGTHQRHLDLRQIHFPFPEPMFEATNDPAGFQDALV
jgi:hypothetical protein|tara:strand:- start:453 stop:671 length:219 start_codon:yes stop_codon:yes gene_type:complete